MVRGAQEAKTGNPIHQRAPKVVGGGNMMVLIQILIDVVLAIASIIVTVVLRKK